MNSRDLSDNQVAAIGAFAKRWTIRLVPLVLLVVGLILAMGAWFKVPAGHSGILIRLGAPQEIAYGEGPHFKFPFIDHADYISVQPLKTDVPRADAVTAPPDLQSVTTDVAINFTPNPAQIVEIYRDFRTPEVMAERIIKPAAEESLKAATAKYKVQDLIGQRDLVRAEFLKILKAKVEKYGVTINDVFMTQFAFSPTFQQALDAKNTANEQANKAENELRTAKAEAEKRVAQAEGEARAIKAQAEAIQKAGGDEYVKLKWIEKWDGKLPYYQAGSAPSMMMQMGK